MADYGFRSESSDGFAQIDGAYSNYALWDSGYVSAVEVTTYPGGCISYIKWNKAEISFPFGVPEPPLITVNGSGYIGLIGYIVSGGLYVGASIIAENATSIHYGLYAPASVIGGESDVWGMRVFDGAGGVVFDSKYSYLLVRDVLTGISVGNTYSHAEVNFPHYVLGTHYHKEIAAVTPAGVKNESSTSVSYNKVPPVIVDMALGCVFPGTQTAPTKAIIVCEPP